VLAVNQHAVPYGGIELARLYDGKQRVVANVGGRSLASFGVLVRNASSKEVLFSQKAHERLPKRPPLELLATPRGPVRRAKPYPRRPYGGPFETIVARGRSQSAEAAVETVHRFKPSHVETRWRITRRRRGRLTVDVLFPSWGGNARIEAVLRDGRRITLAQHGVHAREVPAREVAYYYVAGEDSGYVVVPAKTQARGRAHILRPKRQSSAPRPGPTLAIQIVRQGRFKRTSFTARIAPAATAEQAAAAARRLRG
jgi:hypothetical protein